LEIIKFSEIKYIYNNSGEFFMGTRALINYNGNKFLYIHYDGDPATLGVELKRLRTHTKDAVKRVASKHDIDNNFITGDPSYCDFIDYEYDVRPNGVFVRTGGYLTLEASKKKHKFVKM